MALLYSLISVGGQTAGFLVPIFRAYDGANQDFVQQIDQHDRVASLEPLWVDGESIAKPDIHFETAVGRPAIWAFRDQDGKLHVGDGAHIQSVGLCLLTSGALDRCPMAAAEMASFCKAEVRFPHTLRSAFASLSQLSRRGAETWRDAVVLLPAIKQDLAHQLSLRDDLRAQIDAVVAVTYGGTTHIYVSSAIAPQVGQLSRWRTLAEIFDIKEFKVHAVARGPGKFVRHIPAWSLVGVGGVARFVITRPPFCGSQKAPEAPPAGAIAHGPSVP